MSRSARAGTATLTLSVDHAPDGLGGVFVLAAHLIDAGRQCDGIVLLVDEPHRLGAGTHAQVEPSVLLLEELGERQVDGVRVTRRLATGQHYTTRLPRHRLGRVPQRAIDPHQEHIPLSVHGHGSPSTRVELSAVSPRRHRRSQEGTSAIGARGIATSPGGHTWFAGPWRYSTSPLKGRQASTWGLRFLPLIVDGESAQGGSNLLMNC